MSPPVLREPRSFLVPLAREAGPGGSEGNLVPPQGGPSPPRQARVWGRRQQLKSSHPFDLPGMVLEDGLEDLLKVTLHACVGAWEAAQNSKQEAGELHGE